MSGVQKNLTENSFKIGVGRDFSNWNFLQTKPTKLSFLKNNIERFHESNLVAQTKDYWQASKLLQDHDSSLAVYDGAVYASLAVPTFEIGATKDGISSELLISVFDSKLADIFSENSVPSDMQRYATISGGALGNYFRVEVDASRLESFPQHFKDCLLSAILSSPFEPGVGSSVDDLLRDALDLHGKLTLQWVSDLFLANFDKPAVSGDLLAYSSRLSYEEASPTVVLMAIAGINHTSVRVQEAAIRAFENWANADSLKVLENVHLNAKWLQEYVAEVIDDIKAANV